MEIFVLGKNHYTEYFLLGKLDHQCDSSGCLSSMCQGARSGSPNAACRNISALAKGYEMLIRSLWQRLIPTHVQLRFAVTRSSRYSHGGRGVETGCDSKLSLSLSVKPEDLTHYIS